MARTPIPPRARAVRKMSRSERRSRCAMLIFSGFFPRATGAAGLVLTARILQRYKIFTRSATPAERAPLDRGCHFLFRAKRQPLERLAQRVDSFASISACFRRNL